MYLEHYGLREFPFSLTPDTSFFFAYGHYRDAFNTLVVALQNGEGFIKVTGEVGTGKTLLCRKLLNHLEGEKQPFTTAYIPNPYLTPNALLLAVASELGLEIPRNAGAHKAMAALNQRLVELNGDGKQVVLCIDEAQAMPDQTLEAVRLITNLETEKRKLLHVVLFGQPELDQHLAKPSVRQLRQRITFSYTLQPLDQAGIESYLAHRLVVAGSDGSVHFEPAAIRRLHSGSGGIPRLVNILAHKALMLGYGQGTQRIRPDHVTRAIADTEGARQSGQWPKNRLRTWLLGALALTLLAAALLWQNLPLPEVFG
ncbi:MAG: ExeA family protein [Pseudomonadota bacterium]